MSAEKETQASDLGVGRPTKRRNGAAAGGLPVADSRPQFEDGRVAGVRCAECRYPSPQAGQPWCPVCAGAVAPATFAPRGVVWSSTVIGLPVGKREPPFALAYVDLVDGPRVLVLLNESRTLPIGTQVTITGTENGDLVAVAGETDDES